jgi:hypothetical protein
MAGEGSMHAGHWNSSSRVIIMSMRGGPVVLFNFTQRGESDMLVLSPFSQFMATSLYQAHDWGVVLYEQDWLESQTTGFTPLYTDIDLEHQWLKSMGDAADKLDIKNIQYCMSLPRHILHAFWNSKYVC